MDPVHEPDLASIWYTGTGNGMAVGCVRYCAAE